MRVNYPSERGNKKSEYDLFRLFSMEAAVFPNSSGRYCQFREGVSTYKKVNEHTTVSSFNLFFFNFL